MSWVFKGVRIQEKTILPPLEALNEIERDRVEVLLKLRSFLQGFEPVLVGRRRTCGCC